MVLSSRAMKGVVHRGMGVERGVVRGVIPGEASRLKVVGLMTPLKAAVKGLRLGYVNICGGGCGWMCANACSGGRPCNTVKGLDDIIPRFTGGVLGEVAADDVAELAPSWTGDVDVAVAEESDVIVEDELQARVVWPSLVRMIATGRATGGGGGGGNIPGG